MSKDPRADLSRVHPEQAETNMFHKYQQTREESAVLLRQVIAELGAHDAPFHPTTFAVWYEHFAGINPALSAAVAEACTEQPRLGPDAVARLYIDHVAEPDDEASDEARRQLMALMQGMERSAAATGDNVEAYGEQLAGLSRALQTGGADSAIAGLAPQLDDLAGGTARMKNAVHALQATLADSESELQRLRHALERSRIEAVTDTLSGLNNRKGFDHALAEMLSSRPPDGSAHCLVLFDIDHFKRINDTYGHPVGDTVIASVGQVLAHIAAPSKLHAARIGGEEFALLMPATKTKQAQQTAETVRKLVKAMKLKRRGTQDVIATMTISSGVAAWVAGDDAGSLLNAADAALYRAKEHGRDRVVVA